MTNTHIDQHTTEIDAREFLALAFIGVIPCPVDENGNRYEDMADVDFGDSDDDALDASDPDNYDGPDDWYDYDLEADLAADRYERQMGF